MPKLPTKPHRDTLTVAMEAATAALAERTRLEALRGELATRHLHAERAKVEATAALGKAEAELMLASPHEESTLRAQVEAVKAQVREADQEAARCDAAQRALPVKLDEADGPLQDAAQALDEEGRVLAAKALRAYERELHNAVRVMAAVVRKGHALKASLNILGAHLEGIRIPTVDMNPFSADILNKTRMLLGDEVIPLAEGWTDDAAAMELYRTYQPVRQMERRLDEHRERIQRERERRRLEQADMNRVRTFQRGNVLSQPAVSQPPTPEAAGSEAPGFKPRSWTVRGPGQAVPDPSIGDVAMAVAGSHD
ncbi:hypothetical protein [Roseomonas elaeocarpi]|uniref:Uncharacterized protein n=1 Tax=Roseomonas elaeocarpi TaxID=907779 RepID=A0ABV6JVK6_9PROT